MGATTSPLAALPCLVTRTDWTILPLGIERLSLTRRAGATRPSVHARPAQVLMAIATTLWGIQPSLTIRLVRSITPWVSTALFNDMSGIGNNAIGDTALFNNSTGGNNTAIGDSAGRNRTTGSNNVYIGAGIDGPTQKTRRALV